ncbi:D-isomer specific 2-hydroxyacid dehydrogenase [Aspergillus caelatus]|uniref:D-isomer specific 2-hydroxyacid dehydrogenase n=1 Tax=Aspergillus caelatus TaxID=61420 RepID=A0A5N7AH53_9EURO|nr:D-isomer specific 2-hydroxyacid dehydrogenase [Aspergillus caelatus]KAE8367970.1 D-isomer specific 2-hydroxyacid dehydrogenase [Aspergillus caelatus]
MMQNSVQNPEVLLSIAPWDLPVSFLESLPTISPGIRVITYKRDMQDTEMPPDISQETWNSITILLTWNYVPTKEQVPNLRYVQLHTAGCNHIADTTLFKDSDVSFCTANGVHPPQIAEWVIATFLGFQHHLFEHWDNQKRETWALPESDEDTEDAVGLRMGVLGYGCTGRQCARLANALGMDVHAFTLHERPTLESKRDYSYVEAGLGDPNGDIPSRWYHGCDQLNEFLAGLDLLVITLPLTSLTRGMIAREQFQALGKRNAFVSNVGRGPIVNTDDLVVALNNGTIRGAAVDVTDPEPLPAGHPLWKARNVVITPHVGGNSTHYNERVLKVLARNLKNIADGKGLINRINKSLGY